MPRLFILIGFIILLWSPIAKMLIDSPNKPTIDENRKLAPPPVLRSWIDFHQYTGDTIKWFNDHFGFRDFLIRAKTQIDYSAFEISTRVYIGREGWLFYRSVLDIDQPQIENLLQRNENSVVQGIQRLSKSLSKRDIKLVIMIGPMKDVYYSKYLPASVKYSPNFRQVDSLQNKLRSMKEILFIDSTEILREIARDRYVFHKTDFHWNDPAAFAVAQSLVEKLSILEGKEKSVWSHELDIETRPSSGGEASFMPIFYPPTEQALFVKQNWTQPAFNYVEKVKPFEWIYENKESSQNKLGAMTVMGDSFFDGMQRSGIWIYFNKINRANWNNTNLDEVLNNLPADTKYLFVEFIETSKIAYTSLSEVK